VIAIQKQKPKQNPKKMSTTAAPAAAAANETDGCASSRDAKLAHIKSSIRGIPDFPKPGILFWDVTTLMLDVEAFKHTIDLLVERYRGQKIDVVAGFEARGFLFGTPVALALGLPFVPLRKPGKLPGSTISEEYVTEYSTDKIEVHEGHIKPGQRVLLVDDLVATGGTLAAGAALVKKAGGEVHECACVIELPALKGREKVGKDVPMFVLIEMEGE
jgi:adenine phosphoribosyltransferase